MRNTVTEYAVGVKRAHRPDFSDDWVAMVESVDGVSVVSRTAELLLVRASSEGVSRLKSQMGDVLHVEAVGGFQLLDA